MSHTKLLLVDDEAEFVSALAERLQLRNYDVKTANTALQALAVIYKDPPDVIVLDLKIPGMDGLETLKTIKKFDPAIEVIMLTGHASVEFGLKGMQLGAFDYIMKPAMLNELLDTISQAYHKKCNFDY